MYIQLQIPLQLPCYAFISVPNLWLEISQTKTYKARCIMDELLPAQIKSQNAAGGLY